MKRKATKNPRACVCIHAYAHACSRSTCTCFMHVVDAQPRSGVENHHCRAFVRPPAMTTAPASTRPRWKAPLEWMVSWVFARSFGCSLSLSRWRKVDLPLALWQESKPNFKGLPKVSRVATNHWVFLRCDWSPVSS